MDNYEIFKRIIKEGRYDNTYKLAWGKALIEICSELDIYSLEETNEILLISIARKFIKYYWNQTIIYELNQGTNPLKQPTIIRLIKELFEQYSNLYKTNRKIIFDEFNELILKDKNLYLIYDKTVKETFKLLKQDVSWRFIKLDGIDQSNIYEYKKGDDSLFISSEMVMILLQHKNDLYPLIDYKWILVLDSFNSDKNIKSKVTIKDETEIYENELFAYNNNPDSINKTLDKLAKGGGSFMKYNEKMSELLGILKSINYDNVINELEVDSLNNWVETNKNNSDPRYQEIISKLRKILEDNIITSEEKDEIIKITEQYYNLGQSINGTSELVGIIEGILADNEINLQEVQNLREWLKNNDSLVGTYFFDRVYLIVEDILADGQLDEEEKQKLKVLLHFLLKDNSLNQKIVLLKNKVKNNQIIGNDLIELIDDNTIISKIHREAIQQLKILVGQKCSVYDVDSEIIFISLTLIALLKYDSNYYDYVEEVYQDVYDRYNDQRIEGQIRNVIRKYYENNETRIINYVLENAVVPINFLPSYFDFIYDIYKHNFDECIDSNVDLKDEFSFVFEGIRKNLNYETDDLKLNVTNKTYSLIKTTKNLIQDDTRVSALIDLSVKIVKFIDEYKWNNPTLAITNEYFKYGFEEWKTKNSDENKSRKDRVLTSKWEPHFVLNQDDTYLYIPEHKIKSSYNYSDLKLTVLSDEHVIYENTTPEVYEIIGGYKIVCENVHIDTPLKKIRYKLSCGEELIYDSKEKLYRDYIVFDSLGNELKNNKDYSGVCLICTKESEIDSAQLRTKKENYNILFKNVTVGEYITIGGELFNFSTILKPGLIGQTNGVVYQILEENYDIYNKLDGIVYESTVGENKIYITINGSRECITNHPLEKKKRGLYNNYLIQLNLPNNRYRISIDEQEGNNIINKKEFNFIVDDSFERSVEILSQDELLVKIHSNLNGDEESVVSLSESDPNYISIKNHNYIIPLDKFMYRLDESSWTIYKDYNSDYLWMGNINSNSKFIMNGAAIDKVEVLSKNGVLLSTMYPKTLEHGYKEIQASSLKSYYEEDMVILAFYVENTKVGLIKLYCKSIVLKDETRFNYDTSKDILLCNVKYIGNNIKIEISNDENEIVYYKENILSGESFEIDNLKPFTNYYVKVLEPAEGFTLDGDKQLYYKKIRFYTPESLLGRRLYIYSVDFNQTIQGRWMKKSMKLMRTFLRIDEKVDDNIYSGRILYRRDDGFKVPKNINPVEVEINSDINGGTVEAWITNEGDSLLMNFNEKTILNNMDDPKAVDIEKYYLKIERDNNE